MKLIERGGFLATLNAHFENSGTTEGHCVLITGEAGIGKTSLVREFCNEHKAYFNIYQGSCDALFTPRPLAPLYDIMWQVNSTLWPDTHSTNDRSKLFAEFFREIKNTTEKRIIIFEDIHWADEATLDFIKFFARRINQLKCLFILTFRDNEIQAQQQLRNMLAELPPASYTKILLPPLSKKAVEEMAIERGYNGEDVYSVSGGNPFYVSEILSSYSYGVPENIKDSIISAYNRTEDSTRDVWDLLSVIPTRFEIKYLAKFEPEFLPALDSCMDLKILIVDDGLIFFKHELFRRTIENSLSPLKRIALNKRILEMLKESFEQNHEIERIVHHAKNANEYDVVLKYAPIAAKQAAGAGAHIEASKLIHTAIEYYQGNDVDILIQLYESYAYECYLTNQIKEAIVYTGKSLALWKKKENIEKIGNCLRFLSRLWWFDGNSQNAENYGTQAVNVLENEPDSRVKGLVFSNMSQLKMLGGKSDECISWGEKAIEIARKFNDSEILAHALNNVGTVQMRAAATYESGKKLLLESLDISLVNSFHEHVARAYTNLGINTVAMKNFKEAAETFEKGIMYCEERELDSWSTYMHSWKGKMNLETGNWDVAYNILSDLLRKEIQPPVVGITTHVAYSKIKMRRGDADAITLLIDAYDNSFRVMDLQCIVASVGALLEYEWLSGQRVIHDERLEETIKIISGSGTFFDYNEFEFWLRKARNKKMLNNLFEGYDFKPGSIANAVSIWEKFGCPYERALALYEGDEGNKREAIVIMQQLGAKAVYEKMKGEMKSLGIKNIPRGVQKSTSLNPAFLTKRELDVLQLLNDGMPNKEIADKLFISAKTVDHHISSILSKLEVKSRAKAVHEAIKIGIIK
jgi:ATP/maltotriose-dependent transcriptional regulator MalT